MQVPLLDLKLQYAPLREKIRAEFDEIAESQSLILGPKVTALESAISAYCGSPECIAVSSGTDAQLIILMALGIGPGDSVITSPYTFFATAGCIARTGATPLFVDIDPATYNLSVPAVQALLESHPETKAIIPVHLFGCCADMAPILDLGKKFGIPVLEDAAQSLGARHPLGSAGAIGEFGWFSFYPTKNLGAFGDAGMVTCRDPEFAAKIRALRNHGMEPRYYHKWIGGNFRMDAIQAAVLNVKLPHLDSWSQARQTHARKYIEHFQSLGLLDFLTAPVEPFADSGLPNHHIYNQFVVRAKNRDGLRSHLQQNGIGSEIYYPLPLHLQECFRELGYQQGAFPESEKASKETLALPVFPELSAPQQDHVIETIRKFYLGTR